MFLNKGDVCVCVQRHRGQTFAHVRVVVRVEVFLQNIQGSVKAL